MKIKTERSRRKKENEISIVIEAEKQDIADIMAKEMKKAVQKTNHLLHQNTSFKMIIMSKD